MLNRENKVIKMGAGLLLALMLGCLGIFAVATFMGCAAQPSTPDVIYQPYKVDVPVYKDQPKVQVLPLPPLPISNLAQASTIDVTMKAWIASCQVLKHDDDTLRTLIAPYAQ